MLRQQLVAVRETAKALVASIDAALSTMDRPSELTDGACRHDARLEAGTMGNPNRWICQACGHEGDA
jgi:hypothetical protein